ncbi:MAG: alkaline phosphatase family protein [Candidatus Hodarchaeales archaeon]|jgi:predicted AlkP superfamily phosphohydrolase/phosphomutase
MTKILIIGLDGATWDIIDPLIDRNELPTLKKLISEGVRSDLISSYPPLTPVAWSSFLTGKNPGQHGVYDFFKYEDQKASPVTSKALKEDLWDVLGESGKKIISIGVPLTYPPKKVKNGIVISGFPAVNPDSEFIYPTVVAKELNKYLTEKLGHRYYPTAIDFFGNINTPEKFIESHYKFTDQIYETFNYLTSKHDWDVCMVYFLLTDSLTHQFWKYFDKNHPDYKKSEKYENVVFDCYKYADSVINRILSSVPDNTIVLVVSDHGFGPISKIVYLNNLLIELGLLEFKKNLRAKFKFWLFKRGFTLEKIYNIFIRFLDKEVKKSSSVKGSKILKIKNTFLLSFDDIDYKKTKAYCRGSGGGLIINEVEPEKKKMIGDLVINEATKVRDPEDGEKIIKKAVPREELYQGDFVGSAPDIILTPFEKYMIPNHFEFGSNKITTKSIRWSGGHRMEGIFLAKGPHIKRGESLRDAGIIDIFPTILHILNVSIPRKVAGNVLKEIYTSDGIYKNRKLSYTESEDAEKERIKQRLKKLKV